LGSVSIFVLKSAKTMNKKYVIGIAIAYGITSIILFLLQALMSGGMAVASVISVLTFVAIIAIPVLYLRKMRKEQNDTLTFKDAFLTSFIGLLIGGVVSTIFTALYVGFIDPEYVDRMIMSTLEMQKGFMEGSMSEEQMVEIMQQSEKGIRDGFTPVGMLKSLAYVALFYLVVSLIIAAFMKKVDAFRAGVANDVIDN
jgi:hypothetical protein